MIYDWAKAILFGVATADAVGVPAEFNSRETMQRNPVQDITGYGTWNQPPGTWSDDSSLTFCLAEAIAEGFSLQAVADQFIRWRYDRSWTPHGDVFDIGLATDRAIVRLKNGTAPEVAGGFGEEENGNGSLMRILPLLLLIKDKPVGERFAYTRLVSSVTHGHIRSVLACFYYLELARLPASGASKEDAYRALQETIPPFLHGMEINPEEQRLFHRLLQNDIAVLPEQEIGSSGYVLHTLEAAVWCLMTTGSYREAVLKGVNLGGDTDTTAAVVGGLAGILYGFGDIPAPWVEALAGKEKIEDLARRLARKLDGTGN